MCSASFEMLQNYAALRGSISYANARDRSYFWEPKSNEMSQIIDRGLGLVEITALIETEVQKSKSVKDEQKDKKVA